MDAVNEELTRVTLAAQRAEAVAENERALREAAQERLWAAEARAADLAQRLKDAGAERHLLQLGGGGERAQDGAAGGTSGLLPMVRVGQRATSHRPLCMRVCADSSAHGRRAGQHLRDRVRPAHLA